ncbi:HET-domain-containing protein [Trichoderma reesei RUT C-30]|uniref:HET-domain-containing protein n=1 Tax=Hypocrea jecorina (strain ATCC 56765 / BCRC 32924 / NRRL 11460 / Rut C-30) TaxID=1344414 RepID=A0A024SMV7_HYPJR|nr:HET-domain-containing protein [Trichoderma reesei RUT C-30]
MGHQERINIRSPAGAAAVYKDVAQLDSVQEEIRMLHLECGSGSSLPQCTLHRVSLRSDPPPKYEALSYTWGDENDRREIAVNGYIVDVTVNLYSALRRLRLENETRVLWIDALCINQTDLDERSQQVQLMRNIYTLMQTVQEVILPAKATFLYGPIAIDMSFLLDAFSALTGHMFEPCCSEVFSSSNFSVRKCLRKLGSALTNIKNIRTSHGNGASVDLWETMTTFRARFATDNRDKVHGVLGLINSWPGQPIIPNYRTTAEAIYCQAAISTATGTKSLLPLHFPLQKHACPGLSSWCPNPARCSNFEAFWKCLCWDMIMRTREAAVVESARSTGTQSYEAFVGYCHSSPKSVFHPQGLSQADREAVLRLDPKFETTDDTDWGHYSQPDFLTEQFINGLTHNTTMFLTDSGYLGLGPPETQVGDEVWCLFGGQMPFVLRQLGAKQEFLPGQGERQLHQVFGICYVHGIMDGEIANDENISVKTLYLA